MNLNVARINKLRENLIMINFNVDYELRWYRLKKESKIILKFKFI